MSDYFTPAERREIEDAKAYIRESLVRSRRKVPTEISPALKGRIRQRIEAGGDRVVTTVGGRLT